MNKRFKISEDWVIVIVGAIILMLSTIFPQTMPVMPKALETTSQWLSAAYMFFFIWVMVGVTSWVLGRQLRGIFTSLLLIFLIALVSNVISNISFIKNDLGLEVVFFAVLVGGGQLLRYVQAGLRRRLGRRLLQDHLQFSPA